MTPSDPEDIPASVPAPEHIGLYRIERRLGRGGMGEVFLAWDGRLERRVAVKRIMSPEQAEGGEVDPRSDFFSLGALLYEMLTGKAPFRGANPGATLKQVLTVSPPPLSGELPAPSSWEKAS